MTRQRAALQLSRLLAGPGGCLGSAASAVSGCRGLAGAAGSAASGSAAAAPAGPLLPGAVFSAAKRFSPEEVALKARLRTFRERLAANDLARDSSGFLVVQQMLQRLGDRGSFETPPEV